MITHRPVLAAWAVSLGFSLGLARTAWAQGHTPDPYNIVGEYNRQYEPYMYASVPNEVGVLPNQERLDARSGIRNANRFQSFLESDGEDLEDLGRFTPARQAGPGVPYYRANRKFDREFQRNYRPNKAADQSFYESQQQRNDKYFQALREPDVRKRARLLREYNMENLRAARTMSGNRNMSERDRDRELNRDRFGPGGMPLNEDDEETPSSDLRQPPTRSSTAPAAPEGRANTLKPGSRTLPARPTPRTGGSIAPPPPTSGARSRLAPPALPRTGSSATADLLERSDLMERASRAVEPTVPPPAPR